MKNDRGDELSGNASLLCQLSELQQKEQEYGREATAKLMSNGFKRTIGKNISSEKCEGFLEIAETFQKTDARLGYAIAEEEAKVAHAATEKMQEILQTTEEDQPV
ncbi:hypothetical protein HX005_16470 [Acinetobacter sp. R933-2]|uniref:hypothetical protein n=1 Tax=Acinetobacter sp. R933-2 TaxID=2746728 RepID=UPI0025769B9A|nr:hypothetical protein [Acinetobacter sp. R933-2]MDM1248975.1 hypothetical protein [Acinetobacter sp. R933-2]